MKIECLREKFHTAVSKAEKITGKNLTLPVLSCIRLEARNNELTVRATNLDLGVEISIPAKIETEGIVAVPGNILTTFISNLKDDKSIFLEVIEGNLKVSASHNSTLIKSFPSDDFPTIPGVTPEKQLIINAKDFIRGMKAVWYSSSISSMKPELSSVLMSGDDEYMVFAATDSFRLAEKRIKSKHAKDFSQILIPFKNVSEIVKVLENIDDDIEINISKNQISLVYSGIYLVSRIVDGMFPDYKQIIPKDFKTEAIVLKQDLLHALKVSNIFSDKFNQINIRALPSTKTFDLKTKNNDIGENIYTIQASLTGDDVEINFNQKYITDCFQSIESDSVSLNFNGLNKPLVIRAADDASFTYLVMPMNR